MAGVRSRSLNVALGAAVVGAALALTAPSDVRALVAEVGLRANDGFIMGGTGDPLPDADYIASVESHYLTQFVGQLNPADNYSFQALFTPELACPIVCNPVAGEDSLNLGDSINVGVSDLDKAVVPALTAGDHVAVLGYSQSSIVAGQVMNQLIDEHAANLNDLHVTLLADPTSPIGGILDRFQFPDGADGEPQHLPFVNVPLSLDPTPTSGIAADSYIGEYDGFANFPLDPSNINADINALIGIQTVHPYYPDPSPGVNLDTDHIINLGSIGSTNYYAIPAPLPTLAFLYDGGPAGRLFYDALSPNQTLSVDWAYGNPGDPDAGVGVIGADPIGVAGPWQVNALGELVPSGVAGFDLKMDPLQMLAGIEYAEAQSIIGPTNDLLTLAGQPELSQSVVDSLLAGYNATNQMDVAMLNAMIEASMDPATMYDGSPAVSAQPLIDLVGHLFDVFNGLGA